MFERFTDGARRAIVLAQEECRVAGDDVIGTEYLLLGLLPDPDIQRVLDRALASEDRIRERAAAQRSSHHSPLSGHIPFSPRAKRALESALRESQRLEQTWIGTPHLLLALLGQPGSSAVRILGVAGVDLDRLSTTAEEVARQTPRPADDERRAAARSARHDRPRPFRGMLREGDEPTREEYLALLDHFHEVAGQCAMLVGAVNRYGRHESTCRPEQGCTCGLQSVLDALGGPGPAAADG